MKVKAKNIFGRRRSVCGYEICEGRRRSWYLSIAFEVTNE